MRKDSNSNSSTLITLQGFRNNQIAGRKEILFNLLAGKRKIDKPHSHDFFIVILFENATGVHTIDAVDYPIGNQQVHVLFPGQLHKWDMGSQTIGYQLMVEREFFEQFAPYFRFSFTNYQNHPVIKLSQDAFALLRYEFEAIKNELKRDESLVNLISARSAVIASIISREAEQSFTEFKVYQSNQRLATFNMLIDQHYKKEKSVAFYAEQLHISANYLNILSRTHLKISATRLIQQRVSLEAKRMLQSSSQSIKEIAFALGFVDQAYFANFFKAQTGITPSEFRGK